MSIRVRLVKVVVTPVFVLEHDNERLEEIAHPPVTIPAGDWPAYSSERFPREVAAWQAALNNGDAS